MAKKKNKLGKLLAFTTTVAAVGGTCYIFRDKIKQSSIYTTAADKLSDLLGLSGTGSDLEDDDFFFDQEDDDFDSAFSDDQKQEREYTSITITSKDETDSDKQSDNTDSEATDTHSETNETEAAPSADTPSTNQQTASDSAQTSDSEHDGSSDTSEDSDISENADL